MDAVFNALDAPTSLDGHSSTVEEDPEEINCLTIDDVRLIPGMMHFENAYEGKTFHLQLLIQNCGAKRAFVRLCPPNSTGVKFKAFPKGYYLSPGLKITRTVTYQYTSPMSLLHAYAPISINQTTISYRFLVTLSAAVISVEPQRLEFGRIDAVNAATRRTLLLKNSGCKGTQFAIDLGRNELELTVEPMKGTIPAKSSVPLQVELVSADEGEFVEEFWIKTTPPQRVVVAGTFISPKVMVRQFISSLDFFLIDFQRTYYGSQTTKPLVIKNYSSSHSMFYVMAEVKGTTMPLEEAKKIDDNYNYFTVNPQDGRMCADKGSVVQISFAPEVSRSKKIYAACFLKVIRMDCRDIDQNALAGVALNTHLDRRKSLTDSTTSRDNFFVTSTSESLQDLFSNLETYNLSFESSIRVCLHGEKVQARVSLRPEMIYLHDLSINETYEREVLVENQCPFLPIILRYCKQSSVDVAPNQFKLEPNGKIEIRIVFRAAKMGRMFKKITFDLLHPDWPNDCNVIRKVGSVWFKAELVTTIVAKTKLEKQCCLDRTVACRDLKEKLEPAQLYQLTSKELVKKNAEHSYYLNYIRQRLVKSALFKEMLASSSEYDISNPKQLMQEFCKCVSIPKRIVQELPLTPFIPLAPKQLYNIKVTPKSIKLRKVAPYTSATESFTIENQNPFPVRIYLTSTKNCINFCGNSRYLIAAGQMETIPFSFSANNYGRYNVSIDVIVNESAVFQVTAVAQVAQKTLRLDTTKVVFLETDPHYKFITLINNLNARICFDWEVPIGCFRINPMEGTVPAERRLTCKVTFDPHPAHPDSTECILTSESGQKKIVQVCFKKKTRAVVFDTDVIDVGLIPLNELLTRKIIMKNMKSCRVYYNIPNGIPVPGMKISPRCGFLNGKDSQIFTITICLNAVIEFRTRITFNLDDDDDVDVTISGIVEYPKITLKPDMLYFRKITPYAFDRLIFKIKNLSQCPCSVTFPLSDFPEFTITDTEEYHLPHQDRFDLLPNQARVLYLHFHPYYVTTYSFYLPYMINNLIGPPVINGTQTITSLYFLEENNALYEHVEDVRLLTNVPKMVSFTRVNCCAIEKIVEFSALEIHFTYFGVDNHNNSATSNFEIINTSEQMIELCIRIDDLCDPFSLTVKGHDCEIEYFDVSYVIILQRGAKIVFEAAFAPSEIGEYVVKLPIFLHHYHEGKIFNYLSLFGSYILPSITPSSKYVYFENVPIKVRNEVQLTITMRNHFPNCCLSSKSDMGNLFFIFQGGRYVKEDMDVVVLVSFTANKPSCFDVKVAINCSCGSSCDVIVRGAAENSLLDTHAFSHLLKLTLNMGDMVNALIFPKDLQTESGDDLSSATSIIRPTFFDTFVNTNNTCYPLFPADDDVTEYAHHMRHVCKTLQYWLYTQGFSLKYFRRIPDGFTDYCKKAEMKKKEKFVAAKNAKVVPLPLLELMMNLAGSKVKQILTTGEPEPEEELDLMAYISTIYAKTLSFLRDLGAYLPNVKVKYLLNYDQYLLYKKMRQQPPRFDRATFYLFTKQCWIDLILQIFKVLVLSRIEVPNELTLSAKPRKLRASSVSVVGNTLSEPEFTIEANLYSPREKVLLIWLEHCYNDNRMTIWQTNPPDMKDVALYDEDLKDGLALGAVTAYHCPYVKHLIEDMFTHPSSPEQLHHNACKLIQTWKLLKFSYEISPRRIAEPNMVEMVLLVTYLHDVLPSCKPKEVITIKSTLTQCREASVEIHNCGNTTIVYEAVFFQNDHGLFSVNENMFRVAGGKKKVVQVKYYAKSVLKVAASLLFSGETPGHKYGKNLAMDLVGIPDVSYAYMEIPITVKLFKVCEVTAVLESPFKFAADYSVLYGFQPATTQHILFSWDELRNMKIAKEFLFKSSITSFDQDGKRETTPMICCLTPGSRDVWVYFTNPDVGDFSIRVILTGRVTKDSFENIEVELPENYDRINCMCKQKICLTKRCPKIIHVKIPAKNNLFWNASKTMILRYVPEAEYKFWQNRIFTPVGTRIMTLIFNSETHPAKQPIIETVEYAVLTERDSPFVSVKSLLIEDVTSEDYVELPIHPGKDKELVDGTKCVLRLNSRIGKERRFYNVIFMQNGQKPVNVQNESL